MLKKIVWQPVDVLICSELFRSNTALWWTQCCTDLFFHQGVILIHGARIGYFQGDIRLLMDDLKALQPTVFPVVPRLLNRMFDKVRQSIYVTDKMFTCRLIHYSSIMLFIMKCGDSL